MNKVMRKRLFSLLLAVTLVFSFSLTALAQNLVYVTNGAAQRYSAGSVLVISGKAVKDGLPLSNLSIIIDIKDSNSNVVYYGQVKTNSTGYFKTNFTVPSGVSGIMNVKMATNEGEKVNAAYSLANITGEVVVQGTIPYGSLGEGGSKETKIPVATSKLGIVFDANVNYFNNKTAGDIGLPEILGLNTSNEDCFTLYEKTATGYKVVNSTVQLSDSSSLVTGITYFKGVEVANQKNQRRNVIYVVPMQELKANTTYKVTIDKELSANNSSTLGKNVDLFFTTEASIIKEVAGGAKTPVADETIPTSGGKISETGITITIPANASKSEIKVTIEKLLEPENLPIAQGSNLASDVFEILKDKSGDFSKPVTISLNFDKSKVDITKHDLTICYLDEAENKWIPLDNIKVDWDKSIVSGEVTHFTKFAVIATEKEVLKEEEPTKAVTLSDIKDHWAEQYVLQLVASGAIGGYPDGTFKPDRNITRAEFTTILVKAFNLEAKAGKVFADTAEHWAKDPIAVATSHNIVSGYNETTFGPDDNITREQMAVMIVKAAKISEVSAGKEFADNDKVAVWAKTAVATASDNKIINGYPDNTFRPQAQASRAEAATVIIQALKLVL